MAIGAGVCVSVSAKASTTPTHPLARGRIRFALLPRSRPRWEVARHSRPPKSAKRFKRYSRMRHRGTARSVLDGGILLGNAPSVFQAESQAELPSASPVWIW
jgi:hypothetical protein